MIASSEPGDLPPFEHWHGVPVHRVPFHTPLARNEVRRIADVRRQVATHKGTFGPDVVHVHLADASVLYHVLTERDHPCPTVVTVHSAIAASEARPSTVLHRALVSADVVTACSRSMLDQVLAAVPEIESRSRVVLNGIEPARIRSTPMPSGEPRVLFVGRLVHDKGFDVGLRATAALLGEFPTLRVALVGDGPERSALLALAAELGLGDHLEHRGALPLDQVTRAYEAATLVVVPSRYPEPFGIVAVEAGLARRAVVASAAGGLPEIVVHEETGLLVPPDDPAALAEAIRRVLRDDALARRLGAAGRARMLEHFTMARHAEQMEALFEDLAAAVRPGRAGS